MNATLNRRGMLSALASASAALATSPIAAARSQDHLHVGDTLPRFDLLAPGAQRYLVSRVENGRHIAQNIWRREVQFIHVGGALRLRILQHWDGVGPTPGLVTRDSLFETQTFRPLTHTRVTTSNDTKTVEGFLFSEKRITGLPDLADNTTVGFVVPFPEAMYNFETDIEMLRTLPWSANYSVSIPFFHPGTGSIPARYLWYVASEETLSGPDGRPIPCWVVGCDYNTGNDPTLFWLAKSTQILIKMEGPSVNNAFRRKTLLF